MTDNLQYYKSREAMRSNKSPFIVTQEMRVTVHRDSFLDEKIGSKTKLSYPEQALLSGCKDIQLQRITCLTGACRWGFVCKNTRA